MTNSKIICVLGPARSGTSLTAMILNCLGVYFGPKDHLNRPYIHNPKGSWEHKLFTTVNQDIISLLGGNWHQPPEFLPGWANTSEFNELKKRASATLQQEFDDIQIWGWKHPLTCLTLPFWHTFVQPTHYVICLRNPVDVARSLERRNGFTPEKGFYLWLLYIKYALEYTKHRQRIFIYSENWMRCWEDELENLSRFLGEPEKGVKSDLKKEIHTIIDKNLWNSSSTKALTKVLQVYKCLSQRDVLHSSEMEGMLKEALDIMRPEAKRREEWNKKNVHYQWIEQLEIAIQEIEKNIPVENNFILVDEGQWGYDMFEGQRAIPMVERNGMFWGSPADDQAAIRELKRLMQLDVSYIVFGWPAFWWLDYYGAFRDYLNSNFPCILSNSRLIVYDLRTRDLT